MSSSRKITSSQSMNKISSANNNLTNNNNQKEIEKLEKLFLIKLEEKCQLTSKNIQKLIKKYDKYNTNYIEKNELIVFLSYYLHGIELNQINQLALYYLQNNNHINISELTSILLSDQSNRKLVMSTNPPTDSNSETFLSTTANQTINKQNNNNNNDNPLIHQLKVLLSNIKQLLLTEAMKQRKKITVQQRITVHLSDCLESIAKKILISTFKPYSKIDLITFKRCINKFLYPGTILPTDEILEYLFTCCGKINNTVDINELLHLLFDKNINLINKFGFQQTIPSLTSTNTKLTTGPIVINPIDQKTTDISTIADTYKTRKSHTILPIPSNFSMKIVNNSKNLPNVTIEKNYIFGCNTQLYAKDFIYSLNESIIVYICSKIAVIHDISTNQQRYYDQHQTSITCISISNNKQSIATGDIGNKACIHIWSCTTFLTEIVLGTNFFAKGVNAITFLTGDKYICGISCDEKHTMGIFLRSSGELLVSLPTSNNIYPAIGMLKSYDRLVNTYYISKDHNVNSVSSNSSSKKSTSTSGNHLLCTIGEKHLKFYSFNEPSKHKSGSYNSKDSLVCRSYQIDSKQKNISIPKTFTSLVFITRQLGSLTTIAAAESIVDIATAGDNGILYIWRNGILLSYFTIIPNGSITSLSQIDNTLICGTQDGSIIILDNQNFTILNKFSIISKQPSTAVSTNSTASISNSSKRYIKPPDNIKTLGAPVEKPAPTGILSTTDILNICVLSTNQKQILISVNLGKLVLLNLIDGSYQPVLYHHYGPIYGLAVRSVPNPISLIDRIIISGGDDKWVNIWDYADKKLIVRCKIKQAIRCIDCEQNLNEINKRYSNLHQSSQKNRGLLDNNHRSNNNTSLSYGTKSNPHDGCLIAIGGTNGYVYIYYFYLLSEIDKIQLKYSNNENFQLNELFQCQVGNKRDLSDIKISRDSNKLAIGSHDTYIYIYEILFNEGNSKVPMTCELKYLQRLSGHSSYITHIDWSFDGQLLRSTCGAYEILYWNVSKGKQFLSSGDSLESDSEWYTETCVLGFPIMGIWPPDSDGTDINAVDVSKINNLVVTGDDFDQVNVYNYPCVVKNAPGIHLTGHSSDVLNTKFFSCSNLSQFESNIGVDNNIVSVSGDGTVILWSIK